MALSIIIIAVEMWRCEELVDPIECFRLLYPGWPAFRAQASGCRAHFRRPGRVAAVAAVVMVVVVGVVVVGWVGRAAAREGGMVARGIISPASALYE